MMGYIICYFTLNSCIAGFDRVRRAGRIYRREMLDEGRVIENATYVRLIVAEQQKCRDDYQINTGSGQR